MRVLLPGVLLLLQPAAAAPEGINADLVVGLVSAGLSTLDVADSLGVTRRRVQQIVAEQLGPQAAAALPTPPPDLLTDIVAREIRRHGDYYGASMLLGALRAHHPQWHFTHRAVTAAMRALRPDAYEARRCALITLWSTLIQPSSPCAQGVGADEDHPRRIPRTLLLLLVAYGPGLQTPGLWDLHRRARARPVQSRRQSLALTPRRAACLQAP